MNLMNQSNLVHAFPSQSSFRHVQRNARKVSLNLDRGEIPRARAVTVVAKLDLCTHVGGEVSPYLACFNH